MHKINKVAIFGAGKWGLKCFEHYGVDRVECFVDNSRDKQDTCYAGKKVYSISEYVEEYPNNDELTLIIAIAHCGEEIVQQLISYGIQTYFYWQDSYEYHHSIRCLEENENSIQKDDVVVLLGVDDTIKSHVVELYYRLLLMYFDKKNIIFARKANESLSTKVFFDKRSIDFTSIPEEKTYVFIIPSVREPMYELFAQRCNKKAVILNPIVKRRAYDSTDLIYDPYIGNGSMGGYDSEPSEDHYITMERCAYNHEEVINEYVYEASLSNPLFRHVEIETINRCNLNCDFCPAGVTRDTREKTVMADELFYDIINQLSQIKYSGTISTYSNNEPFLDERIVEFNKCIHERLPQANNILYTNGTLLTKEKFIQIINYVDEIVIDNYNKRIQINDISREILSYCKDNDELKNKVTVALRRPNDFLTSRGGDAPNRERKVLYPEVKCSLPWFQLIIRPDGKVSTCCADPLGKRTMGDLTKQRIVDVWYGKEFTSFRDSLSEGRKKVERCMYCDAFNLW